MVRIFVWGNSRIRFLLLRINVPMPVVCLLMVLLMHWEILFVHYTVTNTILPMAGGNKGGRCVCWGGRNQWIVWMVKIKGLRLLPEALLFQGMATFCK